MTKRKLILIIADVLLLTVFILQCVLKAKESAKIFEFKDTPDSIVITGEKGKVELTFENDNWYIGEKKYLANTSSVDSIIESLNFIRALDKVGSANNEAMLNRYELTDGKKIVVTASKDGKVLRSLEVGKEATATSQGYITVDGGKDIYLASGSLRYTFDKSVDELRSKVLWSLPKEEINSVSVTTADGNTWSLSKMGTGDDVVWNVTGAQIDVDPSKAENWFTTVASLAVPVWHNEGEDLGGNKLLSAKVGYGYKTATLEVYEKPAVTEDGNSVFWGTSSEVPYTFELAAYAVKKFQKTPDELSK